MANTLPSINHSLAEANRPINLDYFDVEIDVINRAFEDLPVDGSERTEALARIGKQIETLQITQQDMVGNAASASAFCAKIGKTLNKTVVKLADSGRRLEALHENYVRKTTSCAGRAFQQLRRVFQPLGILASWTGNAAYAVGAAGLHYVDAAADYVASAAYNFIARAVNPQQPVDGLPVEHQG